MVLPNKRIVAKSEIEMDSALVAPTKVICITGDGKEWERVEKVAVK